MTLAAVDIMWQSHDTGCCILPLTIELTISVYTMLPTQQVADQKSSQDNSAMPLLGLLMEGIACRDAASIINT